MKTITNLSLALFLAAPVLYADADDRMESILDAAKAGEARLVAVISSGISVNTANNDGDTALMEAAEDASPEVVRMLIKHGANVNVADKDGNTALMVAADEGRTEVVRILLEAGADVNTRNHEGKTALMMAEGEEEAETARVLTEAGAQ